MVGVVMSEGEISDQELLLRPSSVEQQLNLQEQSPRQNESITNLWKQLDRAFSSPRLGWKHLDKQMDNTEPSSDPLHESAPPEWAMLLVGCLLGLTTGLCVAAFNKAVHIVHEWAWAGTPNEGAAWLRLQRLADTWHRIMLIPVTGGVVVGMMHGLLDVFEQIKQPRQSQGHSFGLVAGVSPAIKAIQAAITLGTGCSLGPEGPSVDIGKSCAKGCLGMVGSSIERKITLVAAGAAAGIASGFNAAVAGCFFAIETVLRPERAENSPPFTTAMIILASVISSTVSTVLLGERPAFTVPTYELKSAAELPLYLILGMLCGVVSVAFSRMVVWFTKFFDYMKDRFGLSTVACPAVGGLGAGIIALRYPGILYWGFTNVEEILHTGKSASAPGIWLLTQLAAAKVVATALCKGSGLVGGLYAPSLMIGAAVGAVFGGLSAEIINSAIPGNAAVAQPQAYALVGMAATLASVCSVPLTSVLLLFELTKDYRILLPLMGAVGLAIWVPSVADLPKEMEGSEPRNEAQGYSSLSPNVDKGETIWKKHDGRDIELSNAVNGALCDFINDDAILDNLKVDQAMSKEYLKVFPQVTIKEVVQLMRETHQTCVLVVSMDELLEGIITLGDIRRSLAKCPGGASNASSTILDADTRVTSICTRGICYRGRERGLLTCYPDIDLSTAKELMEAKDINQLPVVQRGKESVKERKRIVLGLLYYASIRQCLRIELERQRSFSHMPSGKDLQEITVHDS